MAHAHGLSTRPTICSVGDAQRAAQPFFHDVARISYSQRTEKKKRESAVAVEEPLPSQGGKSKVLGTVYLRFLKCRLRYSILGPSTKKGARPADAPVRRQPQQGTLLLALRAEKKATCKRRGSSFQRLAKGMALAGSRTLKKRRSLFLEWHCPLPHLRPVIDRGP